MVEVNFSYFVLSFSEATKLFFVFVPSRKWRSFFGNSNADGEQRRGTVPGLLICCSRRLGINDGHRLAFYDSSPGRGIVGKPFFLLVHKLIHRAIQLAC